MPKLVNETRRDYYAGGLMMLIGLGVVVHGTSYKIGALTDMGPGFFPVAVGVVMVSLGSAIVVVARLSAPAAGERGAQPAEWRAWTCILGGIGAFVVLGIFGGLVPATLAVVFISALADRRNTWRSALLLALGIVAVAVVVFWWALQLQLPLFTWG